MKKRNLYKEFFGVTKAMQKGDIPKKGESGKLAKDMTKKDVNKYASAKHTKLPKKVKEDKMIQYNDLLEYTSEGKVKGADGKACWKGYRYAGTEKGKDKCVKINETLGIAIWVHSEPVIFQEAEYQGRKVKLNKPTRGDSKKFKVYVNTGKKNKDGTIKVKKVEFGQKGMRIKKNNPERRKAFRARHNCDNPGPKTKARYWSCRAW